MDISLMRLLFAVSFGANRTLLEFFGICILLGWRV